MRLTNDQHLNIAKMILKTKLAPNADGQIEKFLSLTSQTEGLKTARNSLQLSTSELARRLNITRNAYVKLEKAERTNAVTIKRLRIAAEAMNCELVYAVVPKTRQLFSEVIWDKVLPKTLEALEKKKFMACMRGQVIAAVSKQLTENVSFRRGQGWSERFSERLQKSHKPQGD